MGNVSTTVSDISTNITNTALNSCEQVSTSNLTIINDVDYVAPPGCEGSDSAFELNQGISVNADCYLASLQKTAAESAVSLTEEQKAAIGINVSTDVTSYQTDIQNITSNYCTEIGSDNTAIINNTRINACGMIITQNATAQQNCEINATIDVVNQQAAKLIELQSGWDILAPITDLFGSISRGMSLVSISASVVCVALIAVVLFLLFRPRGGDDASPQAADLDVEAQVMEFTGGGYLMNNKLFIMIAIFGILLMAALLASKPKLI